MLRRSKVPSSTIKYSAYQPNPKLFKFVTGDARIHSVTIKSCIDEKYVNTTIIFRGTHLNAAKASEVIMHVRHRRNNPAIPKGFLTLLREDLKKKTKFTSEQADLFRVLFLKVEMKEFFNTIVIATSVQPSVLLEIDVANLKRTEPTPIEPTPIEPTPIEPTPIVDLSIAPTTNIINQATEPFVLLPVPLSSEQESILEKIKAVTQSKPDAFSLFKLSPEASAPSLRVEEFLSCLTP